MKKSTNKSAIITKKGNSVILSSKKSEPKKEVKKSEQKKDIKKTVIKKDVKKIEPKKEVKKVEPKKVELTGNITNSVESVVIKPELDKISIPKEESNPIKVAVITPDKEEVYELDIKPTEESPKDIKEAMELSEKEKHLIQLKKIFNTLMNQAKPLYYVGSTPVSELELSTKDNKGNRVVLKGINAVPLAMSRKYSHFAVRIRDNYSVESYNRTIELMKEYISKNNTLELQKKNAQNLMEEIWSLFIEKRGRKPSISNQMITMDALGL